MANNKDHFVRDIILTAMAGYAIGNGLFMKPNKNQSINPLPHTATTIEAEQDKITLTEQQKIILEEKINTILADLQIENMQNKSAEAQREVAVKILQYVVESTKFMINEEEQNQNDEINKAYQSLCLGNNIDYTTAESVATELLLNASGINAKRVTLRCRPKSINPTALAIASHGEHDVVCFKVTGDETFVADPLYARMLANKIDKTNTISSAVDNMNDYCNKFRYEFVAAHEKVDFNMPKQQNTITDMGMER